MHRSLGIVLPAYDPDVERLVEYVGALQALDPAEIRVELDDPSGDVASRLADVSATVNAVARRRGKGAAVTTGFEALDTDVYAFVDADGSTPIESLRSIVGRLSNSAADLVVGSRRHPAAEVTASQSRVRERLGDGFAWLGRRVLPVSLYDYQCGAKAIDAAAWEAIRDDVYEPGFGWDVEVVSAAGLRGLTVEEIPIEWEDVPGSTVDPIAASVTLAGALLRVQRLRALGSVERRPLRERLADHE